MFSSAKHLLYIIILLAISRLIATRESFTFTIILPPISKQLEFRAKIIKLSDNVILSQSIQTKSETLFDSLLQQAFKGELVK